jgi:hypothetical protein
MSRGLSSCGFRSEHTGSIPSSYHAAMRQQRLCASNLQRTSFFIASSPLYHLDSPNYDSNMAKDLLLLVCWWLCFRYVLRPMRDHFRCAVRAKNSADIPLPR